LVDHPAEVAGAVGAVAVYREAHPADVIVVNIHGEIRSTVLTLRKRRDKVDTTEWSVVIFAVVVVVDDDDDLIYFYFFKRGQTLSGSQRKTARSFSAT
jgi:hypothetical protein